MNKLLTLGDSTLVFFSFINYNCILLFYKKDFLIYKKENKNINIYKKLKVNWYIYYFLALIVSGALLHRLIKHACWKSQGPIIYSIIENNSDFDFFNFNSEFHSFPSGHTSTIFAVVLIMFLFTPCQD